MNLLSLLKAIYILLFHLLYFQHCSCDIPVTGRCGRPGLPTKAYLRQISPERSRFDNNERVFVMCEKNEFPIGKQKRICKNGLWTEEKARCGKSVDAQVIKVEIKDCNSPTNSQLLSVDINQKDENEFRLPPNAFHSIRIDENMSISAQNSNCYDWNLKLNKKVQITFMLIDIYLSFEQNETKQIPTLKPIVSKNRNCEIHKVNQQIVDGFDVIGYYYFCDLKPGQSRKYNLTESSDTILFKINTNFTKEIGLQGVFIGDIYTTSYGMSKKVEPDCGQLEIETTGVMIQIEKEYIHIKCNDSFTDQSPKSGQRINDNAVIEHEFVCDANGKWMGEWPVCVPIISCPTDEIIENKDPTVMIEEIGNVYYLNSSQWFAINESWVKYTCHTDNDLMIGKSARICQKNGKWSNKSPYCTGTSLSGFAISGILFVALIMFALIVFIVFRFHSKRVKHELNQAKQEIEETARKRFSAEMYADIREDGLNAYEAEPRKSVLYDSVDYYTLNDPSVYDMPSIKVNNAGVEYLDLCN